MARLNQELAVNVWTGVRFVQLNYDSSSGAVYLVEAECKKYKELKSYINFWCGLTND
jgi:hypothetical protein